MSPKRCCVAMVMVAIFFGAMVGVFAPTTAVAEASELADLDVIRLRLGVERSGGLFVMAAPSRSKLWRETEDRPSWIRWETLNGSPYTELYWEIRFNPEEKGASEDFFGEVNLECGVDKLDVKPKKTPEVANAEWPYTVKVYVCVDGVKGNEKASLARGLRIVWKD